MILTILITRCKMSSTFNIFWFYTFLLHIRLNVFDLQSFFIPIWWKNIFRRIHTLAAFNLNIINLNLLYKYLFQSLNILWIKIEAFMLLILNNWTLFIFVNTGFIGYLVFSKAFQINNWWKVCLSFFFFFNQYVSSIIVL